MELFHGLSVDLVPNTLVMYGYVQGLVWDFAWCLGSDTHLQGRVVRGLQGRIQDSP